jgi:hypothetical protein
MGNKSAPEEPVLLTYSKVKFKIPEEDSFLG